MKIIITEKQLHRLIENIESLGDSNPSGVPEFGSNEVSADVVVTDTDGEVKMSKKKTTDKIGKDVSPQSWYSNGRGLVISKG